MIKKVTLALLILVVPLITGFVSAETSKNFAYDPYYYCAARTNTCSGSGWYPIDEFSGECCCDGNNDGDWFLCTVEIEVYANNPPTLYCYKLIGGPYESNVECIPGPVAAEPIQSAITGDDCCRMPAGSSSSQERGIATIE